MNLNKSINISIFALLFIIIIYLLYVNITIRSGNTDLSKSNQEKILKSIVKIEYIDNDTKDDKEVETGKWIGSGIVFSDDGLVLTNNHVIEDSIKLTSKGEITVCVLNNIGMMPKCDFKADLIVRNPELDLAVIKIKDFYSKDYIKLFEGNSVSTYVFGKTLNIYGYPVIGGDKITITKGIVSGFDNNNNIKTDAEINGGNSGGGAFIGNNFIGVPSSILAESSGKIGYIISKNKIYGWFSSISNKNFDSNYANSDFNKENIIFKGNNIASESSYESDFYITGNKMCVEEYGENTIYAGYDMDGSYICDCREGYEFGGKFGDKCMPKDYINLLNSKFNSHFIK